MVSELIDLNTRLCLENQTLRVSKLGLRVRRIETGGGNITI